MPVLGIVGEQDTSFLEPVRDIVAVVAGRELVVVPDAGHSPQFENPPVWRRRSTRSWPACPAAEPVDRPRAEAQSPAAFSMKRVRSTITRVMRPAATSPWPSLTETRKLSRRPSTRLERGLGPHVAADRGGREVVELDAVPDARGALGELAVDGAHGGLLGQGDDAWCREHRDVAGLERERGVVVGDDELTVADKTGAQGHRPTIDNPAGGDVIEESVLQRTLQTALRHGGDFAEVFAEDRRTASARLDDGKVEEFVSGSRTRRGHPGRARRVHRLRPHRRSLRGRPAPRPTPPRPQPHGRAGRDRASPPSSGARSGAPHLVTVLPESVAKARKVEVLDRADDAARSVSDSIRQVSASYADGRRRVLVANSDGLLAEDDQVRTRFVVNCVAVGDTGMQTGTEAPGRTVGFEYFDEFDPEEVARTAADRALTLLRARPAPRGQLPVVLRRGAGGVLFHEACGHGLEADLVDRDASVFRGRVGEQVASPLVTLVDDGTLRARVGHVRDRRRRRARAAQRAHRERRAHRLHVGPRARPQARAARAAATAGARPTSTCRWCA